MDMQLVKSVYFIGIGGIGMSAEARYFLFQGLTVGGYDKTPSELTKKLVEEAPKPVKEGISKDEANKIKEQLEKAGAKVEIK